MTNTNCLEGLRCPKCGNEDRFFIIGGAQFEVTDDGSDTVGDHEWDDHSPMSCPECNHEGKVRDFRDLATDSEALKQQVDVTLKLSLWLDAEMDEDEIVTLVRSSLPNAFGEALTAMINPVDILEVRQEAEIYGNEEAPPRATLFAVYQLAPDHATYGADAGKFIITSADHEHEYSGPMSEVDAATLARALNACHMVTTRWERGDLAEAARACAAVVNEPVGDKDVCTAQSDDEITVSWHVDDVLEACPYLTRDQAREVLKSVDRGHDANIGINWEVLRGVAVALFPEGEAA